MNYTDILIAIKYGDLPVTRIYQGDELILVLKK